MWLALCRRRRQWHPTPALLPGKSHGRRSLLGCNPWARWVVHDWATSVSLFTFMYWRKKWQPAPVFLPGESQGWGSLVGCRLWGHTELDTTAATEQQQQQQQQHCAGGTGGKEPACQCRRHKRWGFDPWAGKIPLEEGMATLSSILVWRISWTEEPGRLQSIASQRVGHN